MHVKIASRIVSLEKDEFVYHPRRIVLVNCGQENSSTFDVV